MTVQLIDVWTCFSCVYAWQKKPPEGAYLVHTHACMMSIDIDTNPTII
jgi:hypothetical protein